MSQIFYALTHIPEVVLPLFNYTGPWGYLVLFILIFMETGLVIFPWLPGESLIFVVSALAAQNSHSISITILIIGFFIAAFLGDMVNYYIGTRLIKWPWLRKKVMGPKWDYAHHFFEKYGIRAVIFGRFVPLIRTFVPLISGSAGFHYRRFMIGNMIGTFLWVMLAAGAGYYLGTIPFVKKYFSLLLLCLVIVLMIPAAIVGISNLIRRHIMKKNKMIQ